MKKAALAAVVFAGATTAAGLATLDIVAERVDFRMVASLPPAVSSDGRFTQERAMGDERLGRTCIHDRCLAHIRVDTDAVAPASADHTRSFGPAFDQNAKVRLLRSKARNLLMLEADGDAVAVMDDTASAWEWRAPSAIDSGDWAALLPKLVGGALLGWILSLFLVLWRSATDRRLRILAAATEGRVDGGWLRLSDDSVPQRVPDLDDGPWLALKSADGAMDQSAYRGDRSDGIARLLEGDKEDHMSPLRRRVKRLDRLAILFGAGLSLPVVASMIFGMFG